MSAETYNYKGISAGKYVEGTVEALSQEEASFKLKEQKIIITNLVKTNNVDEIAILTWCHDEKARTRSYELFADQFKLKAEKSLQKTC